MVEISTRRSLMSHLAILSLDGVFLLLRVLHFFFGVVWIGHLYYLNFTQAPFFAETDAATKSNAIQKLLPRALWWFRWGAMGTFITGWMYLAMRGHRDGFALFTTSWGIFIILGAILGSIMWANVWFVIWPNQQKVIASACAVAAGKTALPEAAALATRASIASRHNVLFSIPMLLFMGSASHLPMMVTATSLIPLVIALTAALTAIEWNAVCGKMGPLASIKGVIHAGFSLSIALYLLIEVLTK